jgi:hypothetical protein
MASSQTNALIPTAGISGRWNIVSRGTPQWVPDTRPGAAEGSTVLVNIRRILGAFVNP